MPWKVYELTFANDVLEMRSYSSRVAAAISCYVVLLNRFVVYPKE